MLSSFDVEFENICRTLNSDEERSTCESILLNISKHPLVLYSSGEGGTSFAKYFIANGIKVSCFCDTYKTGIHAETGISIISPQQLKENYPDANIIICSQLYYNEILSVLSNIGFDKERIIDSVFLNRTRITTKQFDPMYDNYKWAYNFFNDETSKKIILGRIKCLLSDFPLFPFHPLPYSPINEYFDPDIITLDKNEIFIDGGMYRGETAEDFFKRVDFKYNGYYGFEIDNDNYNQAKIKLEKYENINIIKKGLWSHEAILKFNSGATTSCAICEDGDSCVPVTSLDVLFNGTPICKYPTFIKMDIEGAEKEALMGAENIIKTARPKLAICVYHKLEDIYELPRIISVFNHDYRYYLRHYTKALSGTVLYCV